MTIRAEAPYKPPLGTQGRSNPATFGVLLQDFKQTTEFADLAAMISQLEREESADPIRLNHPM